MLFGSVGFGNLAVVFSRLCRGVAATRWDAVAVATMFPLTFMLCWTWRIAPNLAVGDYVFTHLVVTAIAVLPAMVIARCASWTTGCPSAKLRGSLGTSFVLNIGLLLCVSWIYSHVKAGVALRPLRDAWLYELDRWICLGNEPWTLVRQWIPNAGFEMHLVYMSFFPVIIASIYWMTVFGSEQLANRFTCAVCIAFLIGALAYHAVPAFGPFYYCASGSTESIAPSAHGLQQLLVDHARLVQNSSEVRPWKYLGAFPSLHVGHVVILCWFVRRRRPLLALAAAYLVATMLSTIYLGWHYLLDWAGGALVAMGAVLITEFAAQRCHALAYQRKEGTEGPLSRNSQIELPAI
jgi:hypothetical protein